MSDLSEVDVVAMVYDERGNALDAFEYEPEELERRALELRRKRGEVTTVTILPSPFVLGAGGS
jgi:hypothetical protein